VISSLVTNSFPEKPGNPIAVAPPGRQTFADNRNGSPSISEQDVLAMDDVCDFNLHLHRLNFNRNVSDLFNEGPEDEDLLLYFVGQHLVTQNSDRCLDLADAP
jgi:hypothetical protein